MGYTFNGASKLVILTTGTTSFSAVDLYSRWKDWLLLSDNSKYSVAMSTSGGDPLPGGAFLGQTFFMENGWKIRPQEAAHTLVLNGNLFDRAGGSPFTSTVGSFNVRIEQKTSNIVDLVAVGGSVLTADEIADAVINKADSIWPGWNLLRSIRHIQAATTGKSDQITAENDAVRFWAPDGTTPVFSGTMDTLGNRETVTPYV